MQRTPQQPNTTPRGIDPAEWDRPDAEVMLTLGISLVEVWAVKNMMARGGYALQYPAPEESRSHWKVVAPGS